ncbi:hypothetical protein RIR_jg41973.t3 [Rhizophagus irregularis DAOM 181602=DAOM 197198]|nr:hypothetical protein RIR_jg41973.t3 [Rhizophagus irregularis DAOM 181602=DAOM 197198]
MGKGGDFCYFKISDGLPIFGKGETKIRSDGLPNSKEWKTKDSFDWVVFRRTENNKLRGSGGFLKIGKRRTKVHFG